MSQEIIELMDEFTHAFETDDEDIVKRGRKLLKKYNDADNNQKEFMDDLFITLCGYSFSTLAGISDEES